MTATSFHESSLSPSCPLDASDETLLGAIAGGESGAFAQLYDRYARLALAVAHRVLDDHQAAEDAVQAAFLSVWRFASAFQTGRGSVRAWLVTIVRHAAVDRRRGRLGVAWTDAPLDAVAFALAADEPEPYAQVVADWEADHVRAALQRLPFKQREAIELAYFGGLTCREIALRTGTPIGTVKGRLRLGLHKLRTELGDLAPNNAAQASAA